MRGRGRRGEGEGKEERKRVYRRGRVSRGEGVKERALMRGFHMPYSIDSYSPEYESILYQEVILYSMVSYPRTYGLIPKKCIILLQSNYEAITPQGIN